MLRKLRGILSTAAVWALVWLPIGLSLALILGPPSECLYCAPHWLLYQIVIWAIWGALSGALFAVILILMERRRTLAELSLRRNATWGALASLFLPLLLAILELIEYWSYLGEQFWRFTMLALVVASGLGAACAALTLKAAQRASHGARAAA